MSGVVHASQGYVRKVARTIAAEEVAKIVENAPSDLDTLREIADYIASDKVGAAAMATNISKNAAAIAEAESKIEGKADASVLNSAVTNINDKIGTVEKRFDEIKLDGVAWIDEYNEGCLWADGFYCDNGEGIQTIAMSPSGLHAINDDKVNEMYQSVLLSHSNLCVEDNGNTTFVYGGMINFLTDSGEYMVSPDLIAVKNITTGGQSSYHMEVDWDSACNLAYVNESLVINAQEEPIYPSFALIADPDGMYDEIVAMDFYGIRTSRVIEAYMDEYVCSFMTPYLFSLYDDRYGQSADIDCFYGLYCSSSEWFGEDGEYYSSREGIYGSDGASIYGNGNTTNFNYDGFGCYGYRSFDDTQYLFELKDCEMTGYVWTFNDSDEFIHCLSINPVSGMNLSLLANGNETTRCSVAADGIITPMLTIGSTIIDESKLQALLALVS